MIGGKTPMKRPLRMFIVFASAIMMTLALAIPASADNRGPCSGDGHDYAQHHIKPLATGGDLGNDGHVPGTHRGFSACLGVH